MCLAQTVRRLGRRGRVLALVVLLLSLGMGAGTAGYAILDGILFRPHPVDTPSYLLCIYHLGDAGGGRRRPNPMEGDYFEWLRTSLRGSVDLAAAGRLHASLTIHGEVMRGPGEVVTTDYFGILGVRPALGRTFTPDDARPSNTTTAVVISHSLWLGRFGGRADAVGTRILINEGVSEVIGVMPPGFRGLAAPLTERLFWVPWEPSSERSRAVIAVGRLRRGVSVTQARAMVTAHGRAALLHFAGSASAEPRFVAWRLSETRTPEDPTAKLLPARLAVAMLVVVGGLLVVVTANAAGLMLASTLSRTGEFALRLALGCSRRRVGAGLLVEALVVSSLGAGLGLVVSRGLLVVFRATVPATILLDPVLDLRIIPFVAIGCLSVAGVVAAVSMVEASRVSGLMALQSGVVRAGAGRLWLRHWVVVPQVALAVALAALAGATARSLLRLEVSDVGFSQDTTVLRFGLRSDGSEGGQPALSYLPRRAGSMSAEEAQTRAKRWRKFYRDLTSTLAQVPGIEAFAVSDDLPMFARSPQVAIVGEHAPASDRGVAVERATVSPGYFRTLDQRIVRGRDFGAQDTLTGPPIVILSESAAARLWPGRDPIGHLVGVLPSTTSAPAPRRHTVVGVVQDVRGVLGDFDVMATAYFPMSQEWMPFVTRVVLKASGPLTTAAKAGAADAIRRADRGAEVFGIGTIRQDIAATLYPRRLATGTLVGCSLVALLVAFLGIYATVSYSVAERRREIAVRIAHGAGAKDIARLLAGEGLWAGALGLAIGVGLARAGARLASSVLVDAPALDVLTVVSAIGLVASAVIVGYYLPGRSAARVAPMSVLRHQ